MAVQAFAVGPLMLMAGRALQGLSDGWIVALCYTLIADLFPSRLVPRIFAAEAVVWALAAVLGPFAGGLVVEGLGWRSALTVSLPVIALFFAVMPFALPPDEKPVKPSAGAPRHRLLPPGLFRLTARSGVAVGCCS